MFTSKQQKESLSGVSDTRVNRAALTVLSVHRNLSAVCSTCSRAAPQQMVMQSHLELLVCKIHCC